MKTATSVENLDTSLDSAEQSKQKRKQFLKRVEVGKKSHGWDSSTTEDEEEGIQVLHLADNNDEKSKPFVLQGRLNGKRFNVLIDTGSPVTIFTQTTCEDAIGQELPNQRVGKK